MQPSFKKMFPHFLLERRPLTVAADYIFLVEELELKNSIGEPNIFALFLILLAINLLKILLRL